jgi:Lon protease-like protein
VRSDQLREETPEIPLFPLDTVLFPGMTLPLHIFEERYRLMVNACMGGNRQFGVLLAKPAQASSSETAVYPVGTAALITHVDALEDGDLDIQTAGTERFRVLSVLHTEPYAVGRIEAFPLEQVRSPAVMPYVQKAGELFVRYLRLVAEVLGTVIRVEEAPRDASTLAYLIGIALQVSMEEKQDLLSVVTLPALLARETQILSREETLLTRMRERQETNTGYMRCATGQLSLN